MKVLIILICAILLLFGCISQPQIAENRTNISANKSSEGGPAKKLIEGNTINTTNTTIDPDSNSTQIMAIVYGGGTRGFKGGTFCLYLDPAKQRAYNALRRNGFSGSEACDVMDGMSR